jgi:uncharacterized membrane protein YecN with MAPEG domain
MASLDNNILNKWCVFAWISVVLITKNVIFSAMLGILRLQNDEVNIPEDATIFIRPRRRITNVVSIDTQQKKSEEWSLTNRIMKVLSNETEYVPYFLILFLAFVIAPDVTTTEVIVYGSVFTVARYMHNIGLIFRLSYSRILGFLLSILVLATMVLDLAITISIKITK